MALDFLSTGVPGLDEVLNGGLPRGHIYLVRGEPGTGKTTIALQFLAAGHDTGEMGLYLTLSQTATELREIAAEYGMSLEGIEVEDAGTLFATDVPTDQTVVKTLDLEVEHFVAHIRQTVENNGGMRVVIDSLIDLRLRSIDLLAYRRLIRQLIDALTGAGCTVLLLDSDREYGGDSQIVALVHGVISLQRALPGYGIAQRRLEVNKMRAVAHAEGFHDFTIEPNGVRVFPRLASIREEGAPTLQMRSTSLPDLDELLGGGIEEGTSTMVFGQAGVGKSTLGAILLSAAAGRGDNVAAFLFEEHPTTFLKRADNLNLSLSSALGSGKLIMRDLRAGEVLPGQFVHEVLHIVEKNEARIVLIDSVSGYITAAADKEHGLAQLNTLLATLRSRKVATVLVVEQTGLVEVPYWPEHLSVLADTIILLRQYEAESRVRRSIVVLKRRAGHHSTEVREFSMEHGQVVVRPIPVEQLQKMRHLSLLTSHGTT